MKKILLFTNMSSIQKHWEHSLEGSFQTSTFDDEAQLLDILAIDRLPVTLLVDELSLSDVEATLNLFTAFEHVSVLLFNSVPEVHHAASLLSTKIKGYENSFIHKTNLLAMITSVEDGKNWLFADLTNYIVTKFINEGNTKEPEFMQTLTQKEKVITKMIVDGLSNQEIADAQKIALSTVKGHIKKIFTKAGITDRVALVLKCK